MKSLLDTDMVSELMRGKNALLVARADAYASANGPLAITMTLAGEIGGRLLRAGRTIGVSDTCIAATAVEHGRTLVTGNTRHFEYVREAGFALELDNWREPASP